MVEDCNVKEGEISSNLGLLVGDIAELNILLDQVENAVFIPRPVEKVSQDLKLNNEISTVSSSLMELHQQMIQLKDKTATIKDALYSQLDDKMRLV